MNDDLRARVARTLAAAGAAGFKDTTTKMRPQWRASFGYRGELHGEKSYAHVYVPVDADQVQVNCTAQSPALDYMPAERLRDELAKVNGSYTVGSSDWARILEALGAAPADVAGWDVVTVPHQGLQHRMMLTKVTMPLSDLSAGSMDLALRLALYLARVAREFVMAVWEEPREDQQEENDAG